MASFPDDTLAYAATRFSLSSTTKERLDELEQEKSNIEGLIAHEEMKKPLLTEERIMFWLYSFKNGDIKDKEYQRRVIDTLVNSIYVFDEDGGGKRIVFTFNLSGNNTLTLKSSDIGCYAPPRTGQGVDSIPCPVLLIIHSKKRH